MIAVMASRKQPPPPSHPMCKAIARAIKESGLAKQEVAHRAGVVPSVVTHWTQDRVPDVDMIARLERILKKEQGSLFVDGGFVPSVAQPEYAPRLDPRLTPGWARILEQNYLSGLAGSAEERGMAEKASPTSLNRLFASASS